MFFGLLCISWHGSCYLIMPVRATNTRERKSMKATTPKNRVVEVRETPVGTRCTSGKLTYGDIVVAYYCNSGSQSAHNLIEGLQLADDKIDACGLHE